MQNRADRKKQLIAQGAVHRADVMLARQALEESLRPESIVKTTLHQAVLIGSAALKTRNLAGLPGVNLQTILPLAMSGISVVWNNKPLRRIVLRGAVIAGGVAGVVKLFSMKRKPGNAEPAQINDDPQI